MTNQEARNKRASAWQQMKDLMASTSDRTMTAEERQRFDAFETEVNDLSETIDRMETTERMGAKFAETREQPASIEHATAKVEQLTDGQRADQAFSTYLRFGLSGLEPEERQILQGRAVSGKELRAQGLGNTAGGYLVPAAFRQKLMEAQLSYGAVREVAEVITTDAGGTLPWPTVDDTANVGAILAENTQVTELDVVFGAATLDAYMYTSKLVRVSLQLLQDSGFDIDTWLPNALGVRIARILNTHFTTGTGTAQPLGISTSATIGKTGTTGQTLTVIYDDLVDLIESLDPAYLPNAKWMTRSVGVIRKLKDTTGQPLWQQGLVAGEPDRMLGYPIVINRDMPAMAANARSILFGDFRQGYIVRDVVGIQQLRLEERYADYLQVGFLAFQRSGGGVQNASAYAAYRNSAT